MIYTPTEGDAIQNYSRLFRKPEGCFLNIKDQEHFDEYLIPFGDAGDIDYIVVSDGEEVDLLLITELQVSGYGFAYHASADIGYR